MTVFESELKNIYKKIEFSPFCPLFLKYNIKCRNQEQLIFHTRLIALCFGCTDIACRPSVHFFIF